MAEPFPDWLRGLGAREPGWTYGSMWPLRSRQDEAGKTELGLALPDMVAEALGGWADLLEGPRTGAVTPEAALSLPASGMAASAGRVPANALGMFIGPRGAANLPEDVMSRLHKAVRMFEGSGRPDEEVWRQTGWSMGFPTPRDIGVQPRYELPELVDVDIKPDFPWQVLGRQTDIISNLGSVMEPTQAGQLFQLYPELADYAFRFARTNPPEGGVSGSFNTFAGPSISIKGMEGNLGPLTARERNVMLHELQHAIQQREGWQYGSSAAHVIDRPELNALARDRAYDLYTKARRAAAAEDPSSLTIPGGVDLTDYRAALSQGIHDIYSRVPGEVEARMTQFRSQFPDAMQHYPYSLQGAGPEYEDLFRLAWPGDYP